MYNKAIGKRKKELAPSNEHVLTITFTMFNKFAWYKKDENSILHYYETFDKTHYYMFSSHGFYH